MSAHVIIIICGRPATRAFDIPTAVPTVMIRARRRMVSELVSASRAVARARDMLILKYYASTIYTNILEVQIWDDASSHVSAVRNAIVRPYGEASIMLAV